MHVHVAGNVCIDTTFRLDRFPKTGETLNAISHSDGLGGKGCNQAVAAARTGVPVTLWAAVGPDVDGRFIREQLDAELDGDGLITLDAPTDRSTIAVDATGENMIMSGVTCASAFDPLTQTVMMARIEHGDILVMQGNLSASVTHACLAAGRGKGARTVLNISPLGESFPVLANVDFAIVNEGEARAISGLDDIDSAAGALLDKGANWVIVTLGAQGCLLVGGAHRTTIHIPSPTVKAIDTSGAGDVLCGIFAGCLAAAMAPEHALRIAVRAAAIAVTRPGTLRSCPSKHDILGLFSQMKAEQI